MDVLGYVICGFILILGYMLSGVWFFVGGLDLGPIINRYVGIKTIIKDAIYWGLYTSALLWLSNLWYTSLAESLS